jgi:hypothetical protein
MFTFTCCLGPEGLRALEIGGSCVWWGGAGWAMGAGSALAAGLLGRLLQGRTATPGALVCRVCSL